MTLITDSNITLGVLKSPNVVVAIYVCYENYKVKKTCRT